MNPSIKTQGLTKYYGGQKVPALDSLTIEVGSGEIYGFLGANGAGKSTAIRLLMNFLQPTGGTAQIMGLDCFRETVSIKKHIGYLSGDIALYDSATGKELLDYLESFQVVNKYRRILEKRFNPDLNMPLGQLSRGNRQKIAIIQAFMHEPLALILDEPTSGLDPLMQEAFYQTLNESKERGAAVLMSSHNLNEAQRICDRIGIIRHGKLVHEQSMSQANALSMNTFKIVFAKPADFTRCKSSPELVLVTSISNNSGIFRPTHTISKALKDISKYDVQEFTSHVPDLEDEFLEFYGEKT